MIQVDESRVAVYTGEELPNLARRYVNSAIDGPLEHLIALTPSESKVQSIASQSAAEIIDPVTRSATIFCKGNDTLYAVKVNFHSENNQTSDSYEVSEFTIRQSDTLEEQLKLPAVNL